MTCDPLPPPLTIDGSRISKITEIVPKSISSCKSTSFNKWESNSNEPYSKNSIVTYPPCLPKNGTSPTLIQSNEVLLTPKQSIQTLSDNMKTASPRPPKNTNTMVNSWDSNYDTLAPLPPNVFHKKG
uniref:Uncharacterized protein n=1 Tax=Heterorhabditis bacteriophora TaxID=37862 RepID=A0A1I7X6S9_HETBA